MFKIPKWISGVLGFSLAVLPVLSSAQSSSLTIVPFLLKLNKLILNPLILLMFALSFLYFFYGAIKYLSAEVGDKSRTEARDTMVWGVVGMVVMFSVYGLIGFILGVFGVVPNSTTQQFIRQY